MISEFRFFSFFIFFLSKSKGLYSALLCTINSRHIRALRPQEVPKTMKREDCRRRQAGQLTFCGKELQSFKFFTQTTPFLSPHPPRSSLCIYVLKFPMKVYCARERNMITLFLKQTGAAVFFMNPLPPPPPQRR